MSPLARASVGRMCRSGGGCGRYQTHGPGRSPARPRRDHDMKRILLALAVAALSATAASADPGGFAPPPQRGGPAPGGYAMPAGHNGPAAPADTLVGAVMAPPERAPDHYGMLPGLRKLFSLN